eukprot:g2079.t1
MSAPRKLLARAAREVPRSGIREVMDLAWALEAQGKEIIHLEVGQPDFAAPVHAIDAAKEALDSGHTKYIPNAGIQPLREAIAAIYRQRAPNRSHEADNILVTHGSMFAFSSAFIAALEPGDEVLLPDPGFPNYDMAALAINAVPVKYSLEVADNFLPDPSSLEALITPRTKMLMVNSPSNPTGQVYDLGLLQELADFAQRHGLFLLSDEIYSDMVFDGMEFAPSMLECDTDPEMLMVASGVAKNYAMTGFRVGWLHAAPDVIGVVSKLQEPFISCGVPFCQMAALEAIASAQSGRDSCQAEMKQAYETRRDLALGILGEHSLSSYSPAGAFYLLVDCGEASAPFARRLLEERLVAVAPGDTFGERSANHVRVAFANDDAAIEEGVRRLCEAIVEGKQRRGE